MLLVIHGFTLGFVTVIMMGALFQMLPVMGAGSLPNVRRLGAFCHASHTLGTLCLMLSFIYPNVYLRLAAFTTLLFSFYFYIAVLVRLLNKKNSQGSSIVAIQLALLGLFITVTIGLVLVVNTLGFWQIFINKAWTNIHALWGLVGWVSVLIMAVSFQTIPMFHVAPDFPKKLSNYFPLILLSIVFVISCSPDLSQQLGVIILIILCIYIICLLFLLNKRKRKIPDTTIYFWKLSALSLFAISILYVIPEHFLSENIAKKRTMLLTAMFIFFYVLSIIQGMLLKVLPFLTYTHLQQRCLTNFSAIDLIPHMHELLKKKHGQWLLVVHICTGSALLTTIIHPSIYWLFSSLLCIEFSGLLYLILRTINLYQKCLIEITLLD
jgi:hypothetical protein